jgi:predicted nucleic acid-binding protein
MSVLVDTSAWIQYFRSGENSEKLDYLIDENLIVTNDLILAEIVPFLKFQSKRKLINLLYSINKLNITINWNQIIEYQFKCLKNGLNGISVPDLIISQNAKQNYCKIYSLDPHFRLMKDVLALKLIM